MSVRKGTDRWLLRPGREFAACFLPLTAVAKIAGVVAVSDPRPDRRVHRALPVNPNYESKIIRSSLPRLLGVASSPDSAFGHCPRRDSLAGALVRPCFFNS